MNKKQYLSLFLILFCSSISVKTSDKNSGLRSPNPLSPRPNPINKRWLASFSCCGKLSAAIDPKTSKEAQQAASRLRAQKFDSTPPQSKVFSLAPIIPSRGPKTAELAALKGQEKADKLAREQQGDADIDDIIAQISHSKPKSSTSNLYPGQIQTQPRNQYAPGQVVVNPNSPYNNSRPSIRRVIDSVITPTRKKLDSDNRVFGFSPDLTTEHEEHPYIPASFPKGFSEYFSDDSSLESTPQGPVLSSIPERFSRENSFSSQEYLSPRPTLKADSSSPTTIVSDRTAKYNHGLPCDEKSSEA